MLGAELMTADSTVVYLDNMSNLSREEGMRLLIIGVPRAGKTTKARELWASRAVYDLAFIPLHSTDDLIKQYEWSVFSDQVCDLLKQDGDWIIEGCSAVRGLRKYLREGNRPDFEIVWLDEPRIPLVGRQIGFAASLRSIWAECREMMNENI